MKTRTLRDFFTRQHLPAAGAFVALLLATTSAPLHAASIPIPNGNFSDAGNFGQVGGGLLGAAGTDVVIGSGPWTGSYHGVLGLLAPPQLAIGAGGATLSGIAGINILQLLDNGGYFSQTLAVPYAPGQHYVLSAHVDAGTALDVGLLGSGNIGLALRAGSLTLSSTATAPPQLISLLPLGGTQFQLSLTFDSPDTVSGNVGIQLLGTPDDLIGVSLLPAVTYSNVTLDASAINPLAGAVLGVDGTLQQAVVAQPFAIPLGVQVVDALGDGVPNIEVTFSAPANGASATLSPASVMTDANGLASTNATANTVAGSYTVNATVAGVDAPASFAFTNLAGPPASLTPVGPGADQSATVSTPFDNPLVVGAADQFGNPTPGIVVDFSAPASGASATLAPTSATTDLNGLAQVEGSANAIAGDYAVTAQVEGSAVTASFALSNTLPDGTTIDANGDGNPQSADLGAHFTCALVAHVDQPGGGAYAGVQVAFEAPASGASAVLSNGTDSGISVTATTNANGDAIVGATANQIGGDYAVTASLVGGVGTDPVSFAMRNIESLIFADGFDIPCTPLP
ncbi:MAG TPA: Ig-like domain-containing protein [Dokdonella sp.]